MINIENSVFSVSLFEKHSISKIKLVYYVQNLIDKQRCKWFIKQCSKSVIIYLHVAMMLFDLLLTRNF